MRIKEITWRHRRDFRADMVCEHCGNIQKNDGGYDDDYYHQNVIPNMVCKKCRKKDPDDYTPLEPRYASWQTV